MSRDVPYRMVRFEGTPEEVNDQWLESRKGGLGGSDMGAAMGLNPWKSPYELWLEKTGRAEPDDISGKPAVHWGNMLEPVVAAEFASRHPEMIVRNRFAQMWSREHPHMYADVDRMLTIPGVGNAVLEIKTAGAMAAKAWDDGVPPHYLAQVTHYLAVTGWEKAYVAVLIGGQDYREFEVARDEEDVAAVIQAAEGFWGLVERDEMPEMVGLESETAALAQASGGGNGEWIPMLDADLDGFEGYLADKAEQKRLKGEIRAYEDSLMALIGEASGIETESRRIAWTRSERDGKVKNGGIRVSPRKE